MCPGRFSLTQRIAFVKVNTVFCVCCFVLFKRRKWNRLRFAQNRRVPLFERINKLLQIICLYDIIRAKRSRVYAFCQVCEVIEHRSCSLWFPQESSFAGRRNGEAVVYCRPVCDQKKPLSVCCPLRVSHARSARWLLLVLPVSSMVTRNRCTETKQPLRRFNNDIVCKHTLSLVM